MVAEGKVCPDDGHECRLAGEYVDEARSRPFVPQIARGSSLRISQILICPLSLAVLLPDGMLSGPDWASNSPGAMYCTARDSLILEAGNRFWSLITSYTLMFD